MHSYETLSDDYVGMGALVSMPDFKYTFLMYAPTDNKNLCASICQDLIKLRSLAIYWS